MWQGSVVLLLRWRGRWLRALLQCDLSVLSKGVRQMPWSHRREEQGEHGLAKSGRHMHEPLNREWGGSRSINKQVACGKGSILVWKLKSLVGIFSLLPGAAAPPAPSGRLFHCNSGNPFRIWPLRDYKSFSNQMVTQLHWEDTGTTLQERNVTLKSNLASLPIPSPKKTIRPDINMYVHTYKKIRNNLRLNNLGVVK